MSNAHDILRVDHKFLSSSSEKVVFLYGELGTAEFSKFHKIIKEFAKRGQIQYVVRHWIKVGVAFHILFYKYLLNFSLNCKMSEHILNGLLTVDYENNPLINLFLFLGEAA